MNALAERIKNARIQAKMSEKDLAKKCGVAPSYIIQIESGKKVVNEKNAEKILSVLGEKANLSFEFEIETEEKAEVAKKKATETKVTTQPFQAIEPTDAWSNALSNIIKKYPIYEMQTGKVVGYKELPIIGKKVEGFGVEKLTFVKMADQELSSLRLMMGDVVMIHLTKEMSGKGLYFIETEGKKMIRMVNKEGGRFAVTKGIKNEMPVYFEANKIQIIGKCVRVEFNL